MICPRCASEQSDELKFCKACGANLEAVRYVLDNREIPAGFDWSKTWVADMFLSQAEQKRRKRQLDCRVELRPKKNGGLKSRPASSPPPDQALRSFSTF